MLTPSIQISHNSQNVHSERRRGYSSIITEQKVYYTYAFTACQSARSHLRAIKYLVRLKEYQRRFAADPDQGSAQLMMKCRAITKALGRLDSKIEQSFQDRPQTSTNLQRETDPRDTSRPSGPAPGLKNWSRHPESFTFKTLHHCGFSLSKILLFRGSSCKQLGEKTQRSSPRILSNLNTRLSVTDRGRAETAANPFGRSLLMYAVDD